MWPLQIVLTCVVCESDSLFSKRILCNSGFSLQCSSSVRLKDSSRVSSDYNSDFQWEDTEEFGHLLSPHLTCTSSKNHVDTQIINSGGFKPFVSTFSFSIQPLLKPLTVYENWTMWLLHRIYPLAPKIQSPVGFLREINVYYSVYLSE